MERRLKNVSTELKITQIKSISTEKSKSEIRGRNLFMKRDKMMKIMEIHLI